MTFAQYIRRRLMDRAIQRGVFGPTSQHVHDTTRRGSGIMKQRPSMVYQSWEAKSHTLSVCRPRPLPNEIHSYYALDYPMVDFWA